MSDRIVMLLRQVDQAFDRRSWHGPNLQGALRGVQTADWKADRGLLVTWHRRFRGAVEALTVSSLNDVVRESFTVQDVVAGVAAHDLYHTGQIQLLKRLHAP